MRARHYRYTCFAYVLGFLACVPCARGQTSSNIEIGDRRELFVDHHLIDKLDRATLRMHRPVDRGSVLKFEKPWEGLFATYTTVIHANGKYQAYYRGSTGASTKNSGAHQVVCYAESSDGITWTKPQLDLFPREGEAKTNIVLADVAPDTHNFSPFYDTRPGAKPQERYKGVGGYHKEGLTAYASPDGVRWKKLREAPVLSSADVGFKGEKPVKDDLVFDTQNVPFWSEHEQKYLLYYRVYRNRMRRTARVESDDFITWRNPTLMEYRRAPGAPEAPIEQLYTNQTHPYFRAPHLYIATAGRFMLDRRALTTQQAESTQVHAKFYNDSSDGVLMTSRGGGVYDRTFMEAFISPGIGYENWTSRTNYPALGVVQTGRDEMSVYVNQNYGQPTAHLRRYSMRLDGFGSVHAGYDGGEMITKPLTFAGTELFLNYATSAAGGIRVEVQDASGKPLSGFALDDCREVIGNELDRAVQWTGGDVGKFAGTPIRLRFVAKDADLYALRFGDPAGTTTRATGHTTAGHTVADSDYTRPVLEGGVNGRPFWNAYAKRFIYAPSFEFPTLAAAKTYRFTVRRAQGEPLRFDSDRPTAPLSPVWNDVPEGVTTVVVEGLNESGKIVGEAGSRTFYRSPGFHGEVGPPSRPYDVAARDAFRAIFYTPQAQHWLTHDRPDRSYSSNILPNKVMGALVSASAAYAQLAESPDERRMALEIGRRTADYVLTLRFPADAAYAGVPPTYSLEVDDVYPGITEKHDARWLLVGSAVDAAFGFLDLFDVTKDAKYFAAAEQIAQALVRNQDPDGAWPLLADWKTGTTIAPQRTIPTWMIFLFDRLERQYQSKAYLKARAQAWDWIEKNPMKTAGWDAQFEDMGPNEPYVNLSREQACDVATLLLDDPSSTPQDVERAEELLRFAEDQFVVWDPVKDAKGWHKLYPRRTPAIWLTPGVLEQYHCYAPVARSSAILIHTYLAAHRVTGKPMYLKRARALGNGLLTGQQWMTEAHGGTGEVPTFLHRVSKPVNMLNNSYYAARAIAALAAVTDGRGHADAR